MPTKIDIEFFEPETPEIKREGILMLDVGGKNFLEMPGSIMDTFRKFDILYATGLFNGTKYSLVGCYSTGLKDGYSSFTISELYKDAFLQDVHHPFFIETDFELTGLTPWINQTRIEFETSFPDLMATAKLNKPAVLTWQIDDSFSLELLQIGAYEREADRVEFKNVSRARLLSDKPLSRLEFFNRTAGLTKLFLLFSHEIPKLSRLWYTGTDQRTIALLSFFNKPEETEISITLREIEPEFSSILKTFYTSLEHYTRVLDLVQEAQQNKTVEITFLNLTTALEICHKYFLERDTNYTRTSLTNELMQAGVMKKNSGQWENVTRYYHILKISGHLKFVGSAIPDPVSFASRLRTSRNYYTHYGQRSEKVYSANKLLWVNRTLTLLIKGVLLQLLGAPQAAINKMQMNHAGIFFTEYETNKFSILFTGPPPADTGSQEGNDAV